MVYVFLSQQPITQLIRTKNSKWKIHDSIKQNSENYRTKQSWPGLVAHYVNHPRNELV